MPHQGKRYRADAEKATQEPVPLTEAINRVKAFKKIRFDQSIDLCLHLGIDPKQADQMIRGSLALPHGIGKTKRVIAFCSEDKVEAAREAGAVEAGGEELVQKIEGGWMGFDVAIAEPAMMRVVARLGRTLGPKGLMPSPKSGTVTPNVAQAVREYAAGKIEFRNDAGGNVHAVVGKHSFSAEHLEENARTFVDQIRKMRPASTKGHYLKSATLSATMSPAVPVTV